MLSILPRQRAARQRGLTFSGLPKEFHFGKGAYPRLRTDCGKVLSGAKVNEDSFGKKHSALSIQPYRAIKLEMTILPAG
jgi:hypothetical protein